jgi:hypothetical protein
MFFPKNMFFLIILIVLPIILQIFLSKQKSKWPGLILPIITFGFSLLSVLNIASVGDRTNTIFVILTTFLLTNIPTTILITIYLSIRKSKKNVNELEKMNIKDLD